MRFRETRCCPEWPFYPGFDSQRTANQRNTPSLATLEPSAPGQAAADLQDADFFSREALGTGALSVASTLSGSGTVGTAGPTDYAGTGSLASVVSLAGTGARSRTGAATLSSVITLAGSGALVEQNLVGTGVLSAQATLSGSGTTTGLAEPQGTQKPAGSAGKGKRKRLVEDREEEREETAEELIERLLTEASRPNAPQRKVIRAVGRVAQQAIERPTVDATTDAIAEVDDALARINREARDRYMTTLLALRALIERAQADALAEEDDEEAMLLLL